MRKSMEVLQKSKNELPYDTTISLLGIYQKKMKKTLIQKDTSIPMSTVAFFYNIQDMEVTLVSINR